MEKVSQNLDSKVDDAESIVEDIARRISKVVEKDRSKLKELAEQESTGIITKARREAENIVAEAQQRAMQNISQADERIRNEVKEKTEKEKGSIIKAAKDEAEVIVTRTRQVAEEEAGKIVAESRKEADRLIEEAKEKAKKESAGILTETKQAAEQIVSEAKIKAQRERDQLIASITSEVKDKAESDAAVVLAEAAGKAQKLIAETKCKVCTALAESGQMVIEAHHKMEQAIKAVEKEFKELEDQAEVMSGPTTSRQGSEHSVGRNIESGAGTSLAEEDDERLYGGRLEFRIVPPQDLKDLAQVRDFEQYLLKIPDLLLVGKGASSDGGAWAEVELRYPQPIVKILKGIPCVKEAVLYRNRITIVLESKQAYKIKG